MYTIFMLILMMIPLMLLCLNQTLSINAFKDREKTSPFECGFDPMSQNRIPFSVHFFLISLIFLIFDVEITLLIPTVSMMSSSNSALMISASLFILILLVGTYIEYMEYSLDWKT